jgi:hypothetical protein
MQSTKSARKPSWEIQDLAWKLALPEQLLKENKLSVTAVRIQLVFLAKHCNDSGLSWHGRKSISEITGLSLDTINRANALLRDHLNILEWQQGGGHRTNKYTLKLEIMRELHKNQDDLSVQPSDCCRPTIGHLQVSDHKTTPSDYKTTPSDHKTAAVLPSDRNSNKTLKTPKQLRLRSGCSANPPINESTESHAATRPPVPFAPKRVRLLTGSDAHYVDADTGQRLDWLPTKQAVESGLAVDMTEAMQ